MMVKGPEHRKFRPRIQQGTGTAIHSLQALRDFLTLTPLYMAQPTSAKHTKSIQKQLL